MQLKFYTRSLNILLIFHRLHLPPLPQVHHLLQVLQAHLAVHQQDLQLLLQLQPLQQLQLQILRQQHLLDLPWIIFHLSLKKLNLRVVVPPAAPGSEETELLMPEPGAAVRHELVPLAAVASLHANDKELLGLRVPKSLEARKLAADKTEL